MCDATYKLNDRNMPLFVMMTVDGNGETQVAALVILRSENNASIQCALNAFKRLNPNHTKIEVVIVDKSAANISSFETVFPHAAVQLCIFHAKQAFKRKIIQTNVGLSKSEQEDATKIFDRMLYGECTIRYNELCHEMENIGNEPLWNYFTNNWQNCAEMWAGCYVKHYKHFCNRTTNRVECFNQKLKSVVDRYSPLSKFFKDTILCINSLNVEKDVRTFMKNTRIPLKINDPAHIAPFRTNLTPFAFEKVREELRDLGTFQFDSIRGEIGIVNGAVSIVSDTDSCNCTFRNVLGLPCRHIVKMRILKDVGSFDASLCLPRWLKNYSSKVTTLSRNYSLQYDILPTTTNDTEPEI